MIIQAMPDAVIAAPTCHGSRPSTRAIGPASATNDIIAIEQTKVSNISGFMLKAPDAPSPPFVRRLSLSLLRSCCFIP
ncbi:hypothetical protein LL251_20040 [Sphingobium naphthae]|nr:hypothetical protein [Sphingobium naphthae]